MNATVAMKALLTVQDVARRLSISQRTVWRWVAEGELPPPVRFSSNCVRWKAADIERFVQHLRPRRKAVGS